MSTWNSTPVVPNTGSTFNFPINTGSSDVVYTISYTDDYGCTASTTYTVTPTAPCYCDNLSIWGSGGTVNSSGGTITFGTCNSSECMPYITLDTSVNWLSLNNSGTMLRLAAQENNTGSERTTTVYLNMNGVKCESKPYTVKQSAPSVPCDIINRNLNVNYFVSLDECSGGYINKKISFNVNIGFILREPYLCNVTDSRTISTTIGAENNSTASQAMKFINGNTTVNYSNYCNRGCQVARSPILYISDEVNDTTSSISYISNLCPAYIDYDYDGNTYRLTKDSYTNNSTEYIAENPSGPIQTFTIEFEASKEDGYLINVTIM